MARAFRRKGERIVGVMSAGERALVAGLLDQTRALLAPDVASTGDPFADLVASLEADLGQPADRPDDPAGMPRGTDPGDRDPALARLLPDAHRGDPAVAAEFRRLTEQDLRRRKSDTLTAAIDALLSVPDEVDKVGLERAQAQALLVALTDTRLLLAERLGVRTEADMEALEARVGALEPAAGNLDAEFTHPLAFAVAVYDFLTWLQESLAGALMGRRLLG